MKFRSVLIPLLLAAIPFDAQARGVTPYLPMNLDPEMDRQIERVMVLGDSAVLTRPYAAATVFRALPKACKVDVVLCSQVRSFLESYMRSSGVGLTGLEAASGSGTRHVLPNRHGLTTDSSWLGYANLFWQPYDHLLVNLGGLANEDDSSANGTYVSAGFDFAQLDVGFRDHWYSPLADSSFLQSTQPTPMPSATLSNYRPLTRLGLRYEVSLARLSSSNRIEFGDGLTSGHPKLLGLHASVEPAHGWALGLNRLMQFGGGDRGGRSLTDVLKAFLRPSSFDNANPGLEEDSEFGNQLASFSSRMIFPGRRPFSVYFEYAGEDTSRGRSYLLGNSALSAGLHFPRVWKRFELSFELSEWQNGWYVNHLYGDGLTNDGLVLGHWAGNERIEGDAVGGHSQTLRLGWNPAFGGSAEVRLRSLANESYSAFEYSNAHDVTLRYSYPLRSFTIGAEYFGGRSVFGEDFSRFAVFARHGFSVQSNPSDWPQSHDTTDDSSTELFVDAGVSASEVKVDLAREIPRVKRSAAAAHLGLGARRKVSARSDLGVRLDLDDVDGKLLTGVRALDYRYRFTGPIALSVFLGAARYDLATPAYGLYGGGGVTWRNLSPGWDLGIDFRYATKVARDRLVPEDPASSRPDQFYDIASATLLLTRRF